MTKRKKLIANSVEAALTLAAEKSWDAMTLADIAARAGYSLTDYHGITDKDALADEVDPHFDKAMSEGSFDADETARTRLFDVIMLRFEAMDEYRSGLLSLMKWRENKPVRLANLLESRRRSAVWALTCAGLDRDATLARPWRIAALGFAITQAERAWRKETSSDLNMTMAALDKALRQMEEREDWVSGLGARMFGRKRKPEPEASETSQPNEPSTEHQPS